MPQPSSSHEFVRAVEGFARSRKFIASGPDRGMYVPLLQGWELTRTDLQPDRVDWTLRRDSRRISVTVEVERLRAVILKTVAEAEAVGAMADYVVLMFTELTAQSEPDEEIEVVLPRRRNDVGG